MPRQSVVADPDFVTKSSDDGEGDRPTRLVVRLAVTAVVTAAVAGLLWRLVPTSLTGRTSSVGYSIARDFNIHRYTDAYLLIAYVLPAVALTTFLIIRRWGPLRWRPEGEAPLLPLTVAPDANLSPAEISKDLQRPTVWLNVFWAAARIALPAAAVAFEVSAAVSPLQRGISGSGTAAGIAYAGAVVVVGALGHVRRRVTASRRSRDPGRGDRPGGLVGSISVANGVLAVATVPLLYLVSRTSAVSVGSEHRIVGYPWFPWWLAALVTVAAVAALVRWHLRAKPSERAAVEAAVLVWIVGPVLLFLVIASLPGALGAFQGFDDAHFLATPQLMFQHGLWPWKDLYLIHGILNDGLSAVPGFLAFGNTRWGGNAGLSVYVYPCFWLSMYFLAATFCRRNRLVLIGIAILISVGVFQSNSPELLVVPLCLILFARAIGEPTWGRCSALTLGVFASAVLVPETTFFQIGIVPLVFVFEVCTREKGTSARLSYRRSLRCLVVLVAATAAFLVYLSATGSLADFINFYVVFATDNAIIHGIPVQWNIGTDLLYSFFFYAPVALWLLTIARVACKLVRRRAWSRFDWVLVAAALNAVLYFVKVLQRADQRHAVQSFEATLPLLFLWAIDLLSLLDRRIRSYAASRASRASRPSAGSAFLRSLRYPASCVALVVVAIAAPLPLSTLQHVPGRFHASSHDGPSATPRLGYVRPGAVDTSEIHNLGTVIDRYAGPSAPVLDFTNEPGILYYLLDRVPATRFYHIDEAATLSAQNSAISDIRAADPPVVVFSDMTFGLPIFDGLPTMVRQYAISGYLLDHYRPLADVHGQLLLLRDDLARHPKPMPELSPPAQTTNLYFSSYACNLEDIPNFLSVPGDLPSRPHVVARLVATSTRGTWRVELPAGTRLASYPYVVVRSTGPLGNSSFVFTNQVGAPPANRVEFNALARSGDQLDVDVGGCLQWHGYSPDSLFLSDTEPGGSQPTVSLVG